MDKYKLVPIFVPHLGCPNDCVFCNQRQISGQMKQTSIEEVYKILEKAKEQMGDVLEVAFYGGSFTAICESLQNELLDVALKFTQRIRVSTRPDAINRDILTRLKSKGVKIIELGAQSMCDDILIHSKRGHTALDTKTASKLIKEFGFTLGLQTMVGMPFDTYDNLIYTTNEICKLEPDFVRIYPIVVLKDTELYNMYKNGEYTPLSIDDAVDLCADTLEIYRKNKIKVIRIGLNPSEDLSSDEELTGAYHPALGQMVSSKIYFNKMVKLIENYKEHDVTFGVNKSEISTAIGQKRINAIKLYNEYNKTIKIKAIDIEKNEIVIL